MELIRQQNNLIAEFMSDQDGWEFLYEKDGGYRFYRNPWMKSYPKYDDDLKIVGEQYPGDCNFAFHTSWNWAMAAYHKCQDVSNGGTTPEFEEIFSIIVFNNVKFLHQAVVTFIENVVNKKVVI